MTDTQWAAELLAGLVGTDWTVAWSGVTQKFPSCMARLCNRLTNEYRAVNLSRGVCRTQDARRTEVLRQLSRGPDVCITTPKEHHPQLFTLAPMMRTGDIVVTRVAHHYSLGRMNADRHTETPLEAHMHRNDALSRACLLAGAGHQVFLHDESGPCKAVKVDCRQLTRS
jgi:hypothetical protein